MMKRRSSLDDTLTSTHMIFGLISLSPKLLSHMISLLMQFIGCILVRKRILDGFYRIWFRSLRSRSTWRFTLPKIWVCIIEAICRSRSISSRSIVSRRLSRIGFSSMVFSRSFGIGFIVVSKSSFRTIILMISSGFLTSMMLRCLSLVLLSSRHLRLRRPVHFRLQHLPSSLRRPT